MFAGVRQLAPSWLALSTDELDLDLDTLDASMALNVRQSVSSAAHFLLSVFCFGASLTSLLRRICSCPPNDLAKAGADSFCVIFLSGGRQVNPRGGPLPSTCGFVTSARIASPCFTRPRFELELSSHVPQVSAKRDRLSCTIRSRASPSCVTMWSTSARPRHTCRQHPLAPTVTLSGVLDDLPRTSLAASFSSVLDLVICPVLTNFLLSASSEMPPLIVHALQ